jgi:WD40 repeat protein
LVGDYTSTLETLPEAQEESRKKEEQRQRMEKYTKDLIAFGKGEISALDIIPSVQPWTDEEIAADSQRILKNPTRLDRIRAFAQFVNAESHALGKLGSVPGFCIQHAYNCADSGPVGRTAERFVEADADRPMLLHAPFQRRKQNPYPALLRTLEGGDPVMGVSLTPDGKTAVSGSMDNTLRVWDLETGRCLAVYHGAGAILSVCAAATGTIVAACGKTVIVLRTRNLRPA